MGFRVQDFFIGILVFSLFVTVLFGAAARMNDPVTGYNVTISDEYSSGVEGFDDANRLMTSVEDKSPGGLEGREEASQTGGASLSFIFQGPSIFRNILLGHNESSPGLLSRAGVDPIFGKAAFAAFGFIIALIILGALLRNKL